MTADIRTAARQEMINDGEAAKTVVAYGQRVVVELTSFGDGFTVGAVWGAARVTPTREQLDAVARKTLIEFTGTCVCHEAYTSRGKEDPDCVWHAVGDEFPGDLADAVLALMAGLAEGESSG